MKKLFYLPLFLLVHFAVSAQITNDPDSTGKPAEPDNKKPLSGIVFVLQVGVPSAEMRPAIKNHMGDIGFGGGIICFPNPSTWGNHKRLTALRLGGGLGYTYYGRFKTSVPRNGYNMTVKTEYGLLDLKAIARFRPQLERGFQPFVDLQAGLDLYISGTREDLGIFGDGEDKEDFDNTNSASFTKGIGGGIEIGSRKSKKANMVIRIMYNWGSRVKYVVRDSMYYEPADNTLHYETDRAPVRYVMIQVGIDF